MRTTPLTTCTLPAGRAKSAGLAAGEVCGEATRAWLGPVEAEADATGAGLAGLLVALGVLGPDVPVVGPHAASVASKIGKNGRSERTFLPYPAR